jgi:hypothetical protein
MVFDGEDVLRDGGRWVESGIGDGDGELLVAQRYVEYHRCRGRVRQLLPGVIFSVSESLRRSLKARPSEARSCASR